ncbi:hypothetical protein ABXT43_06455 [Candidatus Pelagibacter sp. Uisw_114]
MDPAIKKIFIEKDQSLMIVIPIFITTAFAIKGFCTIFGKSSYD